MNTTIRFEPETLTIERNLLDEILRAVNVTLNEAETRRTRMCAAGNRNMDVPLPVYAPARCPFFLLLFLWTSKEKVVQ